MESGYVRASIHWTAEASSPSTYQLSTLQSPNHDAPHFCWMGCINQCWPVASAIPNISHGRVPSLYEAGASLQVASIRFNAIAVVGNLIKFAFSGPQHKCFAIYPIVPNCYALFTLTFYTYPLPDC